jgi:hypothetical protein
MEAVCTCSDIHAIFFVVDYVCHDIYILCCYHLVETTIQIICKRMFIQISNVQ